MRALYGGATGSINIGHYIGRICRDCFKVEKGVPSDGLVGMCDRLQWVVESSWRDFRGRKHSQSWVTQCGDTWKRFVNGHWHTKGFDIPLWYKHIYALRHIGEQGGDYEEGRAGILKICVVSNINLRKDIG